MKFSEMIASARPIIKKELRKNRPWQSYIVALGMTFGFLLLIQSGLGESPPPPPPKETAVKTEAQKIENYQMTDEKDPTSPWEEATGADKLVAVVASSPSVMVGPKFEDAHPESEASPTEASSQEPLERAVGVASGFYAALDQGDTALAYDNLSYEFQDSLSYETFRLGYEQLESVHCEIKHSELVSSQRARVDLELEVVEAGRPARYFVTCIVDQQGEVWSVSGVSQLEG